MGKNILVITGSPRKHGNSDMLADAFIKGAERAGHIVTKYEAAFSKISGCRACDTCWSKGVPCSFNDSFNDKFAPLLEDADALVFCMPLYFYNIPASIQATIEKLYAYLSPKCTKTLKISESALLVCGGEKGQDIFSGVVRTYEHICKGMNWKNQGMVIAEEIYQKGEILGTEYLKQAELLGEKL